MLSPNPFNSLGGKGGLKVSAPSVPPLTGNAVTFNSVATTFNGNPVTFGA